MKPLKQLGILLIFIALVTAVLSLVLPTRQKIERTVTINAPSAIIYEKLVRLENFNSIIVWNQRDSLVKYNLSGSDGNVGTSYSWEGDASISGTGKMTITSLELNKKIEHALEFTRPKKGSANSVFILNEINGTTTVTWTFHMVTPRPWNIFNLFYSMDEEMGADFDEGLARLKEMIDPAATVEAETKKMDFKNLNFPATSYAIIKQEVGWDDLSSFYEIHWQQLLADLKIVDSTSAQRVGLIYDWNEKLRLADIAAAIEVPPGTKIESSIIRVIDIPASKAIYVDHEGTRKNVNEMYPQIRKYLSDNKLTQTGPIIERTLPVVNDSARQKTRIIFLVD